jgi:hypothetical protein
MSSLALVLVALALRATGRVQPTEFQVVQLEDAPELEGISVQGIKRRYASRADA